MFSLLGPSVPTERRCCGVGDNSCMFHNKIDFRLLYGHIESHMVLTGRGEQTSVTSMSWSMFLLQKLSEVLADVLTAGPLTHTVTIQGVGPSTFFM